MASSATSAYHPSILSRIRRNAVEIHGFESDKETDPFESVLMMRWVQSSFLGEATTNHPRWRGFEVSDRRLARNWMVPKALTRNNFVSVDNTKRSGPVEKSGAQAQRPWGGDDDDSQRFDGAEAR